MLYICTTKNILPAIVLRIFTTILLLTGIFLQTFSPFVIQTEYLLNKSYIAKNLCVNRDKPMMHCNGKCFLAKQLRAQEKQEQQAPDSKKEKFEVQPFFLPDDINLINIRPVSTIAFCETKDIKTSNFPRSVFHPPMV